MQNRMSVLLVEDDDRLAAFMGEYLEQDGTEVVRVADGGAALRAVASRQYDLIVLDIALPVIDGYAVCRRIREVHTVPIIMVTARTDEVDRVAGFDLGADDYVTKPFSMRELQARIHAAVRRARGEVGPGRRVLKVGALLLDCDSMTGTLGGRSLHLTTYEFRILRVLAEKKNRALTREQLMELAKGSSDESFDRSIDLRISRLRQKLQEDPRRPQLLRTVRGVGYMLAEEGSPP